MNGYLVTEGHKINSSTLSYPMNDKTVGQPLRIGLWHNGSLTWKYPYEKNTEYSDCFFSVASLNCTPDYEIIKIQLSNQTAENQLLKVIIQYDYTCCNQTTAFYSPTENAIMSMGQKRATMLGGSLNGTGMRQYCIQKKTYFNSFTMLHSLASGKLPMSWLAKGDISSMFILETVLESGMKKDGAIWTLHSSSIEMVDSLKREMISKFK
ncbi:MAG: hypothetical protein ACI35R_18580 [Bacillus sp. (in: firmicutes)]